jgi:hypothetical protein
LPGRYKDDNSVYKLLLDNNAQIKDTLCIRDHVIVLGNIELSLNKFGSSELAFSIPKNLKESDLELVRVFFEEKFLKEFMINNKELFTEEAVRRYLCLEDSDSLLFHDQRMQIIIRPKSKPSFTPEALEKFIQELNNHFEEYSVRRTPDTLLFSRLFTD